MEQPEPNSLDERAPDPLYALTVTLLRTNPRSAGDWLAFALIAALLLFSGGGLDSALSLAVVLVLSDLTRAAAMKALDTFDQRLLILPLVRGELPIGTTPGREGAIILVRPFFLLVLSLGTWLISRSTGPGLVLEICRTSAVLAAFTLLPFKPYEGWRLLNLALFSRSVKLEAGVALVTSLLVVALGVWLKAWVLAVFSVFNALATRVVVATAKVAEQLRATGLDFSAQTKALPPVSMRALYDASVASIKLTSTGDPALAARQLADFMRGVHLRLTARPPPVGVTLVLLISYAALVTYFVVGLVVIIAASKP